MSDVPARSRPPALPAAARGGRLRAAARAPGGERLEAALATALGAGAWLLGICVGFQLLFAGSDEFGATDGLGLLPGRVTRLPAGVPLPHIGWNRLAVDRGGRRREGAASRRCSPA